MKKIVNLSGLVLGFLILATSCIFDGPGINGDGNVVKKTRKVGDFSELKISHGMNVYISQGSESKVVVNADENLHDVIETKIEGDALVITANRNIRSAKTKKVFVTVSDLSKISASAGCNVFSETVIKSQNLDLSCSAGSNMNLEVKAENINISVHAGSNAKLEGVTSNFEASASSGANIKSKALKAKNGIAKVSSGANIWLTSEEYLSANASSGGNIHYYGNPESTDIKKSSGGNVIKK